MPKYIDITNQKFGLLTALETVDKSNRKQRSQLWRCLCDCGNESIVAGTTLRAGRIKSCGCLRKTSEYRNRLSKRNRKEGLLSASNKMYYSYRNSAKHRSIEFQLTYEDFLNHILQPCNYCGIDSSITYDVSVLDENRVYKFNGIDRVDNTNGYILENIVPCCTICNSAKMSQSKEDFLNWAQRLIKHQSKKHS